MKMKHQVWDEKMIFHLTVVEAATYERPRMCTGWLPEAAGVAELSEPSNIKTDVGYNHKTHS